MQLIRYEQARVALAAACQIDEVKDIRDKAEALAAYARQAKDTELVQHATEIKVRAERRCGELLATAADNGERATRAHGGANIPSVSNDATPIKTLADIGLTRDESSRYQQLAAMPEEHFEAAIATAKDSVGQVTTAFLLRAKKQREETTAQPEAPRPAPTSRTKEAIAERIERVKADIAAGYLVPQIAARLGITVGGVQHIISRGALTRPNALKSRANALDARRAVEEAVNSLNGIAQGVRMLKGAKLAMDRVEAAALLTEANAALRDIRWIVVQLKEIAHG